MGKPRDPRFAKPCPSNCGFDERDHVWRGPNNCYVLRSAHPLVNRAVKADVSRGANTLTVPVESQVRK